MKLIYENLTKNSAFHFDRKHGLRSKFGDGDEGDDDSDDGDGCDGAEDDEDGDADNGNGSSSRGAADGAIVWVKAYLALKPSLIGLGLIMNRTLL